MTADHCPPGARSLSDHLGIISGRSILRNWDPRGRFSKPPGVNSTCGRRTKPGGMAMGRKRWKILNLRLEMTPASAPPLFVTSRGGASPDTRRYRRSADQIGRAHV